MNSGALHRRLTLFFFHSMWFLFLESVFTGWPSHICTLWAQNSCLNLTFHLKFHQLFFFKLSILSKLAYLYGPLFLPLDRRLEKCLPSSKVSLTDWMLVVWHSRINLVLPHVSIKISLCIIRAFVVSQIIEINKRINILQQNIILFQKLFIPVYFHNFLR